MTQIVEENIPFYRNWHELIAPEKLEVDKESHTEFYGKFICQPLERGFATTIGNSLRRILLSSIQGAAITSVKIEGALHEFTSMKDISEDVSEIILNIKQVRTKLNSEDSQVIRIEKQGPCTVTAADIQSNLDLVEIMNPEQVICTLTGETTFKAFSFVLELEISRLVTLLVFFTPPATSHIVLIPHATNFIVSIPHSTHYIASIPHAMNERTSRYNLPRSRGKFRLRSSPIIGQQ